ncbi:leucine-rich repeat-containing protein 15-like [Culicoides brevitarsis]|uniref:leucine-rich repeat-containing protein 15-like n=1 Tax=Culicoides brevitarsis TaxID=469753 RepID=UPI00307C6A08
MWNFHLVFILLSISTVLAEKHQCFVPVPYKCVIFANATRENYQIEPQAVNSSDITNLDLNGTLPILGPEICENLPNLRIIFASYLGVEEIAENTFKSCKNLYRIDLDWNNITKLSENAFTGLENLEKLYISGGNLQELKLNLSSLINLEQLGLRNLNLTEIDPEIFKNLKNLKELYLYANRLFDLDLEKILNYLPNLKKINIVDNNFKCDRVKKLVELCEKYRIELKTDVTVIRTRHYIPEMIEGVHCLTDDQFNYEKSH